MYPRISDIFIDLFGFELPFPIYSFGAMVAVAVLTAAWLTGHELDRLYEEGRLSGVQIDRGKSGKSRRRGADVVGPSALMGTITILALAAGFGGAKLFHILENLGEFAEAPARMIFSTGGFTFYGGLLVAALAIGWYLRRKGLRVPLVADAVGPGLMLAYGIGRIGCHLAGDGDWGISSDLAARPGWIPEWLWAETYPNNILNIELASPGVYPTPIYEFLMASILFGILWSLRGHPFRAGWLFSLYLLFAGFERILIEQIRVNNTFDLLGMTVTQAEVISVLMMAGGAAGLVVLSRKRAAEARVQPSTVAQSTSS